MNITFKTPDIECSGCAASITRALAQQPGIERVAVDIEAKTVAVEFDGEKTRAEAVSETLADIGFPPRAE